MPEQFGLGSLFCSDYYTDATRNVNTHVSELLMLYVFDREGAILDGVTVTDHDGSEAIRALTMGLGPGRMTLSSGEALTTWYPDFAAALVVSTFPDRLPADPAHAFAPTTRDASNGGPIGAMLDGAWLPDYLVPAPWSSRFCGRSARGRSSAAGSPSSKSRWSGHRRPSR